ncbi:MAG: hypothetical protein MUO64_15755 [Anaerolineales bacterium]|nr:hypothetical protein [Anaerolineales bacterium]
MKRSPKMKAKIYFQQQAGTASSDNLNELWEQILKQNWLGSLDIPVVVRAAGKWFSPLVEQTASSLVQYLNEKAFYQKVKYYRPGSGFRTMSLDLPNPRSLDENKEITFRVSSCCLNDGVHVAEDWLSPFFLITITGMGPDHYLGVSSILDAQAEMVTVPPDYKRAMRLETIYETHHLFRSDVCVVCGSISRKDAKRGAFWAMSNNDILLEVALAKSAGLSPQRLPQINALSRHEVIDWENVQFNGELPQLLGYTASGLIVWFTKFFERIIHIRALWLDEINILQQNSERIMLAIRRRFNFIGKVE